MLPGCLLIIINIQKSTLGMAQDREMADSALQWFAQADSMFSAYHSQATKYCITSPNKTVSHKQGMDVFMDDTWMSNTCYSAEELEELMQTSQQNLSLWLDILQASGRLLNPKKCMWMMFF